MISGLRTIGGVQLGAIVMDWAGVFLLAGMIRYTSLYRKRGRREDKLFFLLLVTDLLMCLVSAQNNFWQGHDGRMAQSLTLAGNVLFQILFDLYALLVLLHCFTYFHSPEKTIRRVGLMAKILFAANLILMLATLPFGLMVTFDEAGMFAFGRFYYPLGFGVPLLFGLIVLSRILPENPRLFFILSLIFCTRLVGEVWVPGMSSTPFLLAIALLFFHIEGMNHAFYSEEEEVRSNG